MRKKLGLMATTAGTFGCVGWENQCYEMGAWLQWRRRYGGSLGTDGAISGPPPSYWVPPVAKICHVFVFLYILINSVTLIQSKEMTTEQRDLLLCCQFWSKLELISKLTSGLKRINFLLRALFRFSPFSTSVSVCLSFYRTRVRSLVMLVTD